VATTGDSAEIVIPDSLPWGGTYTGPDGFKEMIRKFLSHFEEVDPAPQELLEADGDHVVVTVKGVGKTKSGNELSGDSIWLYKIDGGKIARAQFYATPQRWSRHSADFPDRPHAGIAQLDLDPASRATPAPSGAAARLRGRPPPSSFDLDGPVSPVAWRCSATRVRRP